VVDLRGFKVSTDLFANMQTHALASN